jgi:hypothetical protein
MQKIISSLSKRKSLQQPHLNESLQNPLDSIDSDGAGDYINPYKSTNDMGLNIEIKKKLLFKPETATKKVWNDISIINECLYEQDK